MSRSLSTGRPAARPAAALAAAMVVLVLLGGCKAPLSLAEPTPVHGRVVDRRSFDAFIATQPGPFEFRRMYPDVTLVLPQDMTSQDVRNDASRYFARLNAEGKIINGEFR